MATWLKLAATGLLGASLAFACTIGEPDDEPFDDEDAGAAGRARAGSGGRAGSAGASAGSGGARAGAGGAAAGKGGTSGSAGSSGSDPGIPEDVMCDGETGFDPAPSCEFTETLPEDRACLSCLTANCCSELRDCYSTDPHDACGWGRAADGQEEYQCYMDCIIAIAKQDEFGGYTTDDQMACAFECGTEFDGSGEACEVPFFSNSTNVLMSCMHDQCEDPCIIDQL